MKIAYCTDTLWHPGGIQSATIAKADALAAMAGNEVWIVTTECPQASTVLPVSDKVHVVALRVDYYADDWKSKLLLLKSLIVNRKRHRRQLANFLRETRPDVVISTGTSEKFFLPRLRRVCSAVFIREMHFTKYYRRLASQGLAGQLAARLAEFWDYHICIRRYDRIVVLPEEDRERYWKKNRKVTVIPDPLTRPAPVPSGSPSKSVLTAGRFVHQKNHASLIRAWKQVPAVHPDWSLTIYGEGGLRADLQTQIVGAGLAGSIRLAGYSDDLLSRLSEGAIFVLTSLYEGFGMVITEAMSCGLPVVSYACPCGPKDIISDGEDGFLVPVGDETHLSERICELIENEGLRKRMGAAALEKSRQYSLDRIIPMWMALFKQ